MFYICLFIVVFFAIVLIAYVDIERERREKTVEAIICVIDYIKKNKD